jgi:hypothetical protein
LRKHVAILRQRVLSGSRRKTMSLVVGTIVWVVVVTAVVGIVAYALDRRTARQERKQ